jgi:hypothetical protein
MTGLARTSNNCKRQTYPLVRMDVNIRTIIPSVDLENKITGRESHEQGPDSNDLKIFKK